MQQNKSIICIVNFDTGSDLEAELGQSKIVVLSLKDFLNDLLILADEDFVPRPSLHTDSILTLYRQLNKNCLNKLMNLYVDEELSSKNLNVKFIGEIGIDGEKILKKVKKKIFLTKKERKVIGDFFQSNKFFAKLNSKTFSEQLQVIGTELLVDMSRKLIDKFRQVSISTKVNCLITDPYLMNEETEKVVLFDYVHQLSDKNNLLKFIFLISASYQKPNIINIKFNDSVGLSQRPIFITYEYINFAKTYANYDLKNDLNICLHTEKVRVYVVLILKFFLEFVKLMS
ncbi:hypothetical protein ACFW04_006600 [Cataglyphis niger]